MGMTANYLRVNINELENYLAKSSLLEERVYGRLNYRDENLINIDKSWEGMFFLLTGKVLATSQEASTPLLWTLAPPQVIDTEQDMGCGPATYTTIEQTKEVSNALNKTSADELSSKYNGKLMLEMNVYPKIWDNPGSLEYLIEHFIKVKDFYNLAAKNNEAVIIFIN